MAKNDSEQADVEITPEMIRAGRRVLEGFDPEFGDLTATTMEIYSAMWRAGHLSIDGLAKAGGQS